jgi:hypothetical protein
LTAKTSFF